MLIAPRPADENARQAAVQTLGIVDTPPEERFDRLTRAATEQLHAPISSVSIIDQDREWFKSQVGLNKTESPRDISFCGHTIVQGNVFVVEDTQKDERFADNPMVTGEPYVRFYAGVTLHDAKTKAPVGAFCIKDTKPRSLSPEELVTLMNLADQAERELNHGASSRSGHLETTPDDSAMVSGPLM